MTKKLQKPEIVNVETIAQSRLFTIEAVSLVFSNGVSRVYERMRPSGRESVLIVPIIDHHLILIREYVAGLDAYELGFPKGLIDSGESVLAAADRELKEEAGFGANQMQILSQLTAVSSYLSGRMNVVLAQGLYPEKLEGDEPEPLPVIRWPVDNMLALLNEPDFTEARNISALFMVREWLVKQGETEY